MVGQFLTQTFPRTIPTCCIRMSASWWSPTRMAKTPWFMVCMPRARTPYRPAFWLTWRWTALRPNWTAPSMIWLTRILFMLMVWSSQTTSRPGWQQMAKEMLPMARVPRLSCWQSMAHPITLSWRLPPSRLRKSPMLALTMSPLARSTLMMTMLSAMAWRREITRWSPRTPTMLTVRDVLRRQPLWKGKLLPPRVLTKSWSTAPGTPWTRVSLPRSWTLPLNWFW